MALKPENETHLNQIIKGTLGRKKGHKFEEIIANRINHNGIIKLNKLFTIF